LLGSSPILTGSNTPQLDRINPAASGGVQRMTFDLNYIALAFDNTISGWKGHVINAGATFPTKVGVFTTSADLVTTPTYTTLDYGTQFDLGGTFSKELYPGFFTGLGLTTSIGDGWGLFANIGVTHFMGDLWKLSDFRWSLALNGLGYENLVKNTFPNYTLAAGMAFTPLANEDLIWNVGGDILVPTFKNFRLTISTDITYKNMITLGTASRVDVAELIAGNAQGLIPSLSLSYTYKPKALENTSNDVQKSFLQRGEYTVSTGAAPLGNGLWGIGTGLNFALGSIDNKAPEIEIDFSGLDLIPSK